MKTIYIVFIVLTFILHIAYAEERLDLNAEINQANSELLVPQGKDASINLPLFSKTYVRIYEGSKLNFNVVDPDTEAVLIKNSLVIKQINKDTTNILLSSDGKQYEEVTMNLGKKFQINYTYKFMPFMILNQLISHYEENSSNRNIVLFFNIPFLKSGSNLNLRSGFPASSEIIDPSIVQTENIKEKGRFDLITVSMIIIIGLLIIGLVYVKKFRRSKHR